MTPPTAEGGALRSQDVRTTGDPTGLDGTILRVEPRHRRGDARQPERGQRRPERAPDRGPRLPQPLPDHRAARHERDLGRRRGLEHLGGDRPAPDAHGRRQELRLAVLRGRRAPGRVRLARPQPLRVALHAGSVGGRPRRTTRTTTGLRWWRARAAPPAARRSRGSRSTTRRPSRPATATPSSSPTTRATASGSCCPAPTACPTPPSARPSCPARRVRWTSRWVPTATSTTPT